MMVFVAKVKFRPLQRQRIFCGYLHPHSVPHTLRCT